MDKIISTSTENFIKVIYNFDQCEGGDTKPGSIARELGITNAATTDMAQKLSQKKLVEYEKYKELKLTPDGEKMALNIIRKHRLWETFLQTIFGLSMHEIHREAELLEHFTSDFLAEKISHFLGNPTTDPHGDPIPDANGEMYFDKESIILSEAKAGKIYEIVRLSGSDIEFFEFCKSNNLNIGSIVTVNKKYSQNKMTEIDVNKIKFLLNEDVTYRIYVKKLPNK